MISEMEGEISICRCCGSEEIRLIIRISMGKTLTFIMTPEDFALAITGRSDLPGSIRLRNLRLEELE